MQQPAPIPATLVDAQVLELLHQGRGEEAFALLVEHYERRLFRLCFAILREAAQAEDAAQEALIRVWKALPGFDGRAALSTWIYAIARNRCLTALSRRRDLLSLSDEEVAAAAEVALSVPAQQDAPATVLRELVEALPERLRRPLLLFYYEDRSLAEVSAQLGIPEGTVKTHLFRARAALSAQLGQLGITDLLHGLEQTT